MKLVLLGEHGSRPGGPGPGLNERESEVKVVVAHPGCSRMRAD